MESNVFEDNDGEFNGFENIALCFSGGGYRAACFSLGTLSLFEKLGLLDKVRALSTVSGGSITGIKYAQSQASDQEFDEFFLEYFNWLRADKLASNAIGHIRDIRIWHKEVNRHKKRNPINAFAIEYNILTGHMPLSKVQTAIEYGKTHLKRVVFNTTDFTHSMQFRFQNTNGGGLLGNRRIQELGHGLNAHLDKFKLGDILASSSAFPGGFEPIGFPNDFVSGEEMGKMGMDEIGLMDGGIIDNQGISSILTSSTPYNLYFLNDVASPYPKNPFKFAQSNVFIKVLSYLTSIPVLLMAVGLAFYFYWVENLIMTAIMSILVTVMLAFQGLFYFVNRKLKENIGILDKLTIPPRRFGFFVFDRMSSLVKMTSEVFLKSARRSNYESIYSKLWGKVVTSTIYGLRCKNDEMKPEGQNQWDLIKLTTDEIPEKMKQIAEYAASFGTTLWFNTEEKEKGMLDAVVACGEFTACYNLLAHMIINHKEDIKPKGVLHDVYNKTLALWKDMYNDPYFILKDRVGEGNVKVL